MDRETIIKLARECQMPHLYQTGEILNIDRLERFANHVAQHERDACLALRQQLHPRNYGGQQTYGVQDLLGHMNQSLDDYADMIRAREENMNCPPCNNHCNQGRTCPSRQTRETAKPSLDKAFDTAYDEYKTEVFRQQIIQDMRERSDAVINKIKKEAQDIKNIRNQTLEEVAKEFEKMAPFGDTAQSFATYVRMMKT